MAFDGCRRRAFILQTTARCKYPNHRAHLFCFSASSLLFPWLGSNSGTQYQDGDGLIAAHTCAYAWGWVDVALVLGPCSTSRTVRSLRMLTLPRSGDAGRGEGKGNVWRFIDIESPNVVHLRGGTFHRTEQETEDQERP
ncbi:hypothetical protein MPH_02386 [Macrophomina phaseolina MS6]|uniref:Uncharacterized protein n=1 Tax=Macrophomina phaseolina (strain MS6) TaxID=1126212 RepID=K2SCY1_MACPH|nr:hypothetical protein MPH_02386 [Macrophomina phaseolina MS6]